MYHYSKCFNQAELSLLWTSYLKFNPPSFGLGKLTIPVVDKCKYLGIIVSETDCGNGLETRMRNYYANVNI